MSVVFVVVPVIIGGWPIVAAAAAAAAASMGLKELEEASRVEPLVGERTERVAVEIDNVQEISGSLRHDETATFGDDKLRVTVSRDARGKVSVHVEGRGRSKAELAQLGKQFGERLVQQYAYHRISSHLKKEGFKVVDEAVEENRTVRIRFRKLE